MLALVEKWVGESVFGKWAVLVVGSIIVSGLLKIFIKISVNRFKPIAERTEVVWDDVLVGCLERLKHWVLLVWVFYVVTRSLSRQTVLEKPFQCIVAASVVVQLLKWMQYVLKYWRSHVLEQEVRENPSAAAALGLFFRTVQGVGVVVIVLLGLSNVGVDIGALLAGLGVGGIAVALAAQNVLGDLLASLSIVLDKPFVIGDLISTNEIKGVIENIGIKTTRIRSSTGEQIVVSNKDLLESRIKNYKQMKRRRVVKTIGVVYSTRTEVLEKIPDMVKALVEAEPIAEFDLCKLCNLSASSLDYEFSFFVNSSDYSVYMATQEKILLKLVKKFNDEKIEFAFPTQSLFIEKFPVKNS